MCDVGLCSVFIGVSERQETETSIRQLKEKKKNEKDLDNYHKWIQKSRASQNLYSHTDVHLCTH